MPRLMVPESFASLLAGFASCFTAPTHRTFCCLVAGWVRCASRRTVTGVVVAAGAVGWRHVSVFHRFFGRARWEPDALGRVVFRLALAWLPGEGPLFVLVDDTLARKRGKAIALGSMHHDPLLSTVRKAFASFGHVWVILALWVPLPFGPRGTAAGVAIPLLFRLDAGTKRGNRADARAGGARATSGARYRRARAAFPAAARRRTKPELAREGLAVVAGWAAALAPGRTVYAVGDGAYGNRTTMEGRPANVEVVGRLRLDAALFAPPPPRRPGQMGRPRTRGDRLPTPAALAAARTARGTWHRLRLVLYGKTVAPLVVGGTARWYSALRAAPVRFVVVRDPRGRRRDEAFFCTDPSATAAFILTAYARRWALEVTIRDCKQALGFADPQNQTERAVRRTAPFAGLVHALIALWAAQRVAAGDDLAARAVPCRPWYRRKATLAFADLLAALRQDGAAHPAGRSPGLSAPTCPTRRPRKPRARPRALSGAPA